MGFFGFSSGRTSHGGNHKVNPPALTRPGVPSQTLRPDPRPRSGTRFTVPIFSIQIRVECFLGEQRYVGKLWDISRSGACIRSSEPIPGSGRVRILLHDHGSHANVERLANLRWSENVMNANYAGLEFDEPLNAECGFLCTLLQIPVNPSSGRLSRLGPIHLNPWPI